MNAGKLAVLMLVAQCLASALVHSEPAPPFKHIRNPIGEASGEHIAWSVAAPDLNGDGFTDAAVTTYLGYPYSGFEKGLDVFLGDGAGNFSQVYRYAQSAEDGLEGGFFTVVAGDFNEDGLGDLAVLNSRADADEYWSGPKPTVIVFLGDGTGQLAPLLPVELKAYVTPYTAPCERMVADDFNEDGFTDLAVSTMGQGSGNWEHLEVLYGDGTGQFTSITYASENADEFIWALPTSIDSGDLNGDGHTDLMTVGGTVFEEAYTVWLSDGGGNFTGTSESLDDYAKLKAVAVSDLNRDGFLDAVMGGHGGPVSGFLLFGDGTGSFPEIRPLSHDLFGGRMGVKGFDVETGDLNSDGFEDIAFGLEGAAVMDSGGIWQHGAIVVLPGDGNGNFLAVGQGGVLIDLPRAGSGEWFTCYDLDVVNLDADGDSDLLAGTSYRQAVESFLNMCWQDTPQIWMEPGPSIAAYQPYEAIAVMVVDAEGWQNLDPESASILLNEQLDLTDYLLREAQWSSWAGGRVLRGMLTGAIPEGASFDLSISDLDGHTARSVFTY